MASLSYYSNWETTHDHYLNFVESLEASGNVTSSAPFFTQPQTVAEAPAELLFDFNNHGGFVLPEPSLSPFDPIFNFEDFVFSDNYVSLHPPPPEHCFPGQELEFQIHPKRQKLCPEITQNCFSVFIPNPPLLQDLKSAPPFPELQNAPFPAFCAGAETELVKKNDTGNGGGKTLSAQSIAARERRRRITEKTQELGKLIPGGQKMNTAEMFQAAYKYIKYMQTQLSLLQSCHSSSQENDVTYINQELGTLVESSLIQEKLYSNEKCLIPEKFIQSVPNVHQLNQLGT